MLWLIAIIVLSLGLSVFFFGWPGRLISREPRCRACGYALTGITHNTRCTGCGKDFLGANNPYKWSKRQRRRIPLITGMMLSVASSIWLGVLTYGVFS